MRHSLLALVLVFIPSISSSLPVIAAPADCDFAGKFFGDTAKTVGPIDKYFTDAKGQHDKLCAYGRTHAIPTYERLLRDATSKASALNKCHPEYGALVVGNLQGAVEKYKKATADACRLVTASQPGTCPNEPNSVVRTRKEPGNEYEVVLVTHNCPFGIRFMYINTQKFPRTEQTLPTSCISAGKDIVGARSSSTSMQTLTAKPVWVKCGS